MMANTGRPSMESTKAIVMWALGKLEEELALYRDLDMIKKGAVSDGLVQEHRDVVAVRRQFLDNKLVIVSNNRIRMKDARDALALHADVLEQRDRAMAENIIERRRRAEFELALTSIRHNINGILAANNIVQE